MSTGKRALILRWIEAQEKLCEAATPGPWVARILGAGKRLTVWISGPRASGEDDAIVAWNGFDSSATSRPSQAKNARLIAGSRTGYPLALAALKAEADAHEPYSLPDGPHCHECSEPAESGCSAISRIYASLGLDPLQEGR